MDISFLVALAAAILLAVFTWRGGKSGALMARTQTIERARYPVIFAAYLIRRWCLVALILAMAVALSLGWGPYLRALR